MFRITPAKLCRKITKPGSVDHFRDFAVESLEVIVVVVGGRDDPAAVILFVARRVVVDDFSMIRNVSDVFSGVKSRAVLTGSSCRRSRRRSGRS